MPPVSRQEPSERLDMKSLQLMWVTLRRKWKPLTWALLTLLVLRCLRALWRAMLRRYLTLESLSEKNDRNCFERTYAICLICLDASVEFGD